MKRERDSEELTGSIDDRDEHRKAGSSSTKNSIALRHYELIKGLTRKRADGFAKDRAQDRRASPCGAGDQTPVSFFLPSTVSSWRASALHTPFMALVDYLCDSLDDDGAAAAAAGPDSTGETRLDMLNLLPASVETVQLVANDGATLVCARSPPHPPTGVRRSSSGSDSTVVAVEVDRGVGEGHIPGDVVLVYERAHWSDPQPEEDEENANPTVVKQSRVELLGLNPSIFTNSSAWTEAVQRNTLAVLQWQSTLLSHPPGLAQLTFLYQCATGPYAPGRAGWVRALHLPLLSASAVVESLPLDASEQQLLQRHRRVILSTLLILSLVLKHAPSLIPLPHLIQHLLQEFIASPLFIDGFALVISLQAPMFLSSFEIRRVVEALRDVVRVALQVLARPNVCAGWRNSPSAAAAALSAPAETAALGSLFHVLHRLASVGLPLVGASDAAHPLREPLEDLVRCGLTGELVEWLREYEEEEARERAQGESSSPSSTSDGGVGAWTTEEMLRVTHRPPTLAMIRQYHLEQQAVQGGRRPAPPAAPSTGGSSSDRRSWVKRSFFDAEPYLKDMQRTYDPYRTKEALRFVEAATLAAFAELYGPAVRAVGAVLSSALDKEDGHNHERWNIHDVIAESGACVLPLNGAQQLSPGSAGSWLDGLSLSTLRCLSLYGLPICLSFNAAQADREAIAWLCRSLTDGTAERLGDNESLLFRSCPVQRIGYVVVHLPPAAPVVFPVLVTALVTEEEECCCTVYPMRDGDLLVQFTSLAALACTTSTTTRNDFSTGAWLVVGDVVVEGEEDAEKPRSHRTTKRKGEEGDNEDPLVMVQPRFFPKDTPAITYIDVIHRLQCVRRELQRGTSASTRAMNHAGSSSLNSGSSGSGTFRDPASSLWLSYFSTDALPTQRHFQALLPSTRALLTGAGAPPPAVSSSGRPRDGAPAERLETLLEELSEFVPFSRWQTEALRSLADGAVGTTSARVVGNSQVLGSVRVLQGATGSGKTALLHAAGLCKGRQVTAARREQQRGLRLAMQNATTALQKVIQNILAARTLDELYEGGGGAAADGTSSGSTSSSLRQQGFSREIEGLLTAAAAQVSEYQTLAHGLQHCGTPLILRTRSSTSSSSSSSRPEVLAEGFHRLVFGVEGEGTGSNRRDGGAKSANGVLSEGRGGEESGRPSWMQANSVVTLQALTQEAVSRSSNAPLGKLLAQRLENLARVVRCCSAILDSDADDGVSVEAEGPPPPPLHRATLPFLLSPQDRQEIYAAAVANGMSWCDFLSTRLWGGVGCSGGQAVTMHPPSDTVSVNGKEVYVTPFEWKESSASRYDTVRGPDCGLVPLSQDRAAGWHSVFRSKQREFVQLVLGAALEGMRRTLVLFEELGYSVGALSQTSRYTALSCSASGLLRHGLLPFLWSWSPAHLLVDDFDAMTDGLFLTLPSASTVTIASLLYPPALVEQRRTAPRAILSDLLHSLQEVSTTAVRTSILRQLHRCGREEVHGLLRLYGAAGASGAAMMVAAEGSALSGNRSGDDDDGGGDDRDSFSGVVQRPLPGLASLSALEGWTHAVAAELAVEADIWAARHLMERFHQHPNAMRRQGHVGLYFPFRSDCERAARMLAAADSDNPTAPSRALALRCVPFQDPTSVVADEVDVAILCLSGLLQRLARPISTSTAPWWDRPEAAPGGVLEQRLECWLWRVLSRVRRGAVVIGDRRLFARLPTLRHLERFIVEQRETLGRPEPSEPASELNEASSQRVEQEKAAKAYWLSGEVGCAVMAFQCPQHYKSRFIAAIASPKERSDGGEGDDNDDDDDQEKITDEIFEGVRASPSGIRVALHGCTTCRALCLLPYKDCHCPFHACLQPCHESLPLGQTAIANTNSSDTPASPPNKNDSTDKASNPPSELDRSRGKPPPSHPHRSCPFPCIRPLPGCGHLCTRLCGERAREDGDGDDGSASSSSAAAVVDGGAGRRCCPPCQVEGLTQLTCGQRVVSGTSTGQSVQYTVFPHFQRRRCSAPPSPCVIPVTVTCRRCGTASTITCGVLQRIKAQRREEQRAWAAAHRVPALTDEEIDGDTEDLLFRVVDCRGCVAVVNRVAAEVKQAAAAAGTATRFDFEPLPSPPAHWDVAPTPPVVISPVEPEGSEPESEGAEAATRRREAAALQDDITRLFADAPAAARERLAVAFSHEARKASLFRRKVALEISGEKEAAQQSDFAKGKEALKAQLALMDEERRNREARAQQADEELVQQLREEVERQTALQEALDGAMGLLESEALEERERQWSAVDQ